MRDLAERRDYTWTKRERRERPSRRSGVGREAGAARREAQALGFLVESTFATRLVAVDISLDPVD
jgi:hypothetical protein